MGRILVGSCSWTDPQLIKAGTFYPKEAKDAESRLRFYSQNFPIVEVDSSYYGIPAAETSQLWAERTPSDFTFDIKAFSLFTNHPTKIASLPKDIQEAAKGRLPEKVNLYYKDVPEEIRSELWKRYNDAVLPLYEKDKLGVVLLQFPRWFNPSRQSDEHILECAEKLKPFRCAVEFRSARWLNERQKDRTLGFLRDYDLCFVCVDTPRGLKSSIPLVVAATSDIAVVRFHGHNVETWDKRGLTPAERFNWYYSEQDIVGWVPELDYLASRTLEVHALMNTNYGDQAIVNAQLLITLLQRVGAQVA